MTSKKSNTFEVKLSDGRKAKVTAQDAGRVAVSGRPRPTAETVNAVEDDSTATRFKLLDLTPSKSETAPKEMTAKPAEQAEPELRVTRISFQALRPTAQYANDRVEMVADVPPGMDPVAAAETLKALCYEVIGERTVCGRCGEPRRAMVGCGCYED